MPRHKKQTQDVIEINHFKQLQENIMLSASEMETKQTLLDTFIAPQENCFSVFEQFVGLRFTKTQFDTEI